MSHHATSTMLFVCGLITIATTTFGIAAGNETQANHWAFQPIRAPDPPAVKDADWPRDDMDRFVLAKLERGAIKPSPEADRLTLLRRVYLDLIGLPPSPARVEAFMKDGSDAAYEAVVDRLLRSPHYGERWGRHWLDAGRYADSNGFESDRIRPYAWRWRDWVIEALNDDMPFDQFTIQQIAGDLLPNATLDQRIATGFHRNTLLNTEGGVDREEDRVKRTVDRANTVGKVWLGLTLGCVQCHDHKYDPITQEEYYGFYAFFNSLNEPDIDAPTKELIREHEERAKKFDAEHLKVLNAIRDYDSEKLRAWEASLPKEAPAWHVLEPQHLSAATVSSLQLQEDLSVLARGSNNQADTYTFVATTRLPNVTAMRLEVLADARLPSKGPGQAGNGNFVLSSLRIFAKPASDESAGKGQRIKLATARADFSQGGRNVQSVLGDDPADGWAIHPLVGLNHFAIFGLEKAVDAKDGVVLTIELDHQVHSDHNIGRFRISITDVADPPLTGLTDAHLLQALKKPRAKRTGREQLALVKAYGFKEPTLDKLLAAEAEHLNRRPKSVGDMSKAQIITELNSPRGTRVHLRGDFLDPGDSVKPHVPTVLHPLHSRGEQPDRLDLANWIVDEANPLTLRVIVNRIWQQFFGNGLVRSDDDFGTQGDVPSHPELLDYLATEFRKSGWRLKSFHKRIVMSSTYRQSSEVRPALLETDPLNALLSKQNRLRVEAEIVRDAALTVSGLLNRKIGGPSVRPPQPADHASLGFQGNITWPVSQGADRYRRGIYTFFQRTVPFPMLMAFDAADSNLSCTRRERSYTPLQALTIWNDPVFVECSQLLGRRIVVEGPTDDEGRIQHVFRTCFGRDPTEAEFKILRQFVKSRRDRYATDRKAAAELIGDQRNLDKIAYAELAAWVTVARVLLNADEFITRE